MKESELNYKKIGHVAKRLMAGDMARRSNWSSNVFIFTIGCNVFQEGIEVKDMPISHQTAKFFKGKPVYINNQLMICSKGILNPYSLTLDDLCANDWIVFKK